jgi:hypothetical protein
MQLKQRLGDTSFTNQSALVCDLSSQLQYQLEVLLPSPDGRRVLP